MAKLSQLFDLIKTETVEDTDVIAAVRDIEGAPEDVAFTAGDLLKGKASLSEDGGVLYDGGEINGDPSSLFYSFDVGGVGNSGSDNILFRVKRSSGGAGSTSRSVLCGTMIMAMHGRSGAGTPTFSIAKRDVIIGKWSTGDLEVYTSSQSRTSEGNVPEMNFNVELENATDLQADVKITLSGTFEDMMFSCRFSGVSSATTSRRLLRISKL